MDLPNRNKNRLESYDYSQSGAYFITICVKERKMLLSKIIVGTNKIDNKNSEISKFVSTLKRFCNKEYGENIWQQRYYDHVIRNTEDYNEIWQYIENNPAKRILTHKTQGD